MPGPDGRGGPHVFVGDLGGLELDAGDRHHLERALRLRDGDPLTVSDGAGTWRDARFGPVLQAAGPVHHVPRPEPAITIGFALVKGERPEWAVQKLTEIGVDRIVPFRAERSVVRWDGAKAAANLQRLRRVAREAGMQSRRCWLPEVSSLVGFADVAALPGATLADRDGQPPSLARPVVLVGPEGGWSHAERGASLSRVALGPHVLRAETAAVVAGALLCAGRPASVAANAESGSLVTLDHRK